MEVEAAVRRMLVQHDTVRGYVQDRVFRHRLPETIDGTGQRAIVVKRSGGWATPDPVTDQEYPIVLIECWADHTRGSDGEVTRLDNVDNAFAVYRAVDPLIIGVRAVRWGGVHGVVVVTAQRWAEPYAVTSDDLHGYGPNVGDCAVVIGTYALQVIRAAA